MDAAELDREKQMKINLLIQKRETLEDQIDQLRLKISGDEDDVECLKLRACEVKTLFETYLRFNSELSLLDQGVDHDKILSQIQKNYYDIMTQLKRKTEPKISPVNNAEPPSASISEYQIELPVLPFNIPLPKFNGKYEDWYSFKYAFVGIIHNDKKINEVSKLFALRNCLIDDARGKLDAYYDIPGEYLKAWQYLEKSYEINRLIIESHLQAIDELPFLEEETTAGLTKLADNLIQHRTCLQRLGVEIHPVHAVYILQSRLPKQTSQKWNESLNLEEIPSLDSLIEFIYRIAVYASCNVKRPNRSDSENNPKQQQSQSKKMRHNKKKGHRVLTNNASFKCLACKKTEHHPLYNCNIFRSKSLNEKYNIVKRSNVCKICLRVHKGNCNSGKCRDCGGNHNILLHPREVQDVKEEIQSLSSEN